MVSHTDARIQSISTDAVQILRRVLKEATEPTAIAEVGIGIGATTKQFLRLVGKAGGGEVHLFDRQPVIDTVVPELQKLVTSDAVTIVSHGNPDKQFASYAWELATMARDLQRAGRSVELFDFVYLDGAHAFHHDAAACALLKRMIKPGGYLVLDDMRWSFNKSASANPTKRPDLAEAYTDQQLETPHVGLVVDVLLRPDDAFEEIRLTDEANPKRGVFRRRPEAPKRKFWQRSAS
jgi:predicted O-methyltransferase YrrM